MVDDVEARIRRALAHLAPSPAADADLAGALATAERASATGGRRSLWIGVTAAAALIVAVGVVLLRRPSGVAAQHEARTIRVHVDAKGAVEIDDPIRPFPVRTTLGHDESKSTFLAGVFRLDQAFGWPRAPGEDSADFHAVTLEVIANAKAKWRWVQWILAAASSPNVHVPTIRFGLEGSDEPMVEQRLLVEQTVGNQPSGAASSVTFVVRLQAGVTSTEGRSWDTPGAMTLSLSSIGTKNFIDRGFGFDTESDRLPFDSGAGGGLESVVRELIDALRQSAAAFPSGVTGRLVAKPSDGVDAPFGVAFAVLRAFHDAGIDDVRFAPVERVESLNGRPPR